MTSPSKPRSLSTASSKRPIEPTLNFQSAYICPICRHGHISGLAMMDAFACDFCRHIFTGNLQQQTVQVVDSTQPMVWRWSGRNWQAMHRGDANLTVVIWAVGMVVMLLPPSLVWLSSYIFPPLPGSRWAWFPTLWVGCTFLVHFLMVAWLIAEHYQFSFYVSSKIRLQTLFDRR